MRATKTFRAKPWAAIVLSLLVGTALQFASRASAASEDPADIAVIRNADSPDPITAGGDVKYTVSVKNNGPDTPPNVHISDYIPDNGGFVQIQVSSEGDECFYDSEAGAVQCDVGSLEPGQADTVSIWVSSPNHGATMVNEATAYSDLSDPKPGNNSRKQSTTVRAPDPDVLITSVPSQGGEFMTGNGGQDTTPENCQITSVLSPPGPSGNGRVNQVGDICQGETAGAQSVGAAALNDPTCPPTYHCFGKRIDLNWPSSTVDNPLTFRFTYDPSIIPNGKNKENIRLFYRPDGADEGFLVPRCADPSANVAAPDPCIKNQRFRPNGDFRIIVLSSHNGHYRA